MPQEPKRARKLYLSDACAEMVADTEAWLNEYSRGDEGSRLADRIFELLESLKEDLYKGQQPVKENRNIYRLALNQSGQSYYLYYHAARDEGTLYCVTRADSPQPNLEEHQQLIEGGQGTAVGAMA